MFQEVEVTPKLKNCKFLVQIFDCLGHLIRPCHLELVEDMTHALAYLDHPATKTELCSFLGL